MGVGVGRYLFANAHKLLLCIKGGQVRSGHRVHIYPPGVEKLARGKLHLVGIDKCAGVLDGPHIVLAYALYHVPGSVAYLDIAAFPVLALAGHGQLAGQLQGEFPIAAIAQLLAEAHHRRLAGVAAAGQRLHGDTHHVVQIAN